MKNFLLKFCCFFMWVLLFACESNGQEKLSISVTEFEVKLNTENYQILDVRTAGEFKAGYLKGALQADWLNKKEFEERTRHLNPEKSLLVYCASGVRSEQAAKWLLKKGFKEVYNLKGGTAAWQVSGKKLEASQTVAQLSVNDFEKKIQSGIVLVDVGAEWCPPCKKMEPVIHQLETELAAKFKLVKVDGGNDIEVMKHIKADALPTFVIYKNGKEVWRDFGIVSKDVLRSKLTQ
ncbi:MAG: redoxin domain-containing protein [Sediminibacterium sp. Gen4]|jgi:rhodanese-related sulfurtransferase|uniref:rhodanese-like domain-containing protein n=1 Tax=unclassified Sediminibacterium TaxID=2635961 RepID=UPI0015BF68C7|nr:MULTISPECIES: rhodanese-like domain-containing protein [unclassified Sediminibacterium]MBW0165363.1 redoxin domain-containing protein [Sediminibacterium sp.]NWK65152.1 redoxin domain-containing protein [Sediminibacterium sp. Gen4]